MDVLMNLIAFVLIFIAPYLALASLSEFRRFKNAEEENNALRLTPRGRMWSMYATAVIFLAVHVIQKHFTLWTYDPADQVMTRFLLIGTMVEFCLFCLLGTLTAAQRVTRDWDERPGFFYRLNSENEQSRIENVSDDQSKTDRDMQNDPRNHAKKL